MDEALNFFRTYEIWIYGLLALGGFLYSQVSPGLGSVTLGLEQENAQSTSTRLPVWCSC
jgi:hypothetical protein